MLPPLQRRVWSRVFVTGKRPSQVVAVGAAPESVSTPRASLPRLVSTYSLRPPQLSDSPGCALAAPATIRPNTGGGRRTRATRE